MENKITREFIEKVRQAKNTEEFIAIAKENEIEIPEDKAKALFEKLNSALLDEELDGVSGGITGDLLFESYVEMIKQQIEAIMEMTRGMQRPANYPDAEPKS